VLIAHVLPFQVYPVGHEPAAITWQDEPFQNEPVGHAAVPEELAEAEPQELLAVAVQFVRPGRVAPREPVPPVAGLKAYDAGLAPVQFIVTVGFVPEAPHWMV
jgi:hypothetical protein